MDRATTFIRAMLIFTLVLLGAGEARADRLEMKDGRTLSGRILGQDADSITFGIRRNGRLVVERIERAAVRLVVPEVERPVAESGAAGKPKASTKKIARRVVLLVDLSGSMTLGDRLAEAKRSMKARLKTFDFDTRLSSSGFSSRFRPVLQGYRNVTEESRAGLESAIDKLEALPGESSNFEAALRGAMRLGPHEIHLYSDGVQRYQPGLKTAGLLKKLLVILKDTKVHVDMFVSGELPYFGGEPRAEARALMGSLAERSGGTARLSDPVTEGSQQAVGARLVVLRGDTPVERVEVGERYRLRIEIEGLDASNVCLEYLTGLPLLLRSVGKDGRDIVRRLDLPLTLREGRVESLEAFKLVREGDSYAGSAGFVAVAPGGRLATFLDLSGGRWLSSTVRVAP
jgi:hypothetical protein